MLTPTLDSVEALFRKLERELYRTYHHRRAVHKADHFFNFCITAQSLRDYFFERTGRVQLRDQTGFYEEWSQVTMLVAVSEIANSAKHFALRNRDRGQRVAKTKAVRARRGILADVYMTQTGSLLVARRRAPTLTIVLSDGTEYDLYQFLDGVFTYWRDFLHAHKITVRRQSLRSLRGG